MNGTGMAKAVHGVDELEALRCRAMVRYFLQKAIDAVAGEFLAALIDKRRL